MTRKKIVMTFYSASGQKLVMRVYYALLGTVYKALRDDDRIFDITVGSLTEQITYQEHVKKYGGLVIPA